MQTAEFGGIIPEQLHGITIYSVNPDYATVIDYRCAADIVLHISIRPYEGLIIFNSFFEGEWRTELRIPMPVDFPSSNAELKIRFDASDAYIGINGSEEVPVHLDRPLNAIDAVICGVEHKIDILGKRAEINSGDAPASGGVAKDEPTLPGYVKSVFEEFETVKLETIKRSGRPMPDFLNPIVISVIKDEFDRLADFFRHYRLLGVERFVVIDNGSTDGSREFLLAQPDTDVIFHPAKFDWMLKQGWINSVVRSYGYGRWYICADADEHVVFEGSGERTFRDLAAEMEHRNVRRVRGLLVDMYCNGALLNSKYPPHGRLIESYPYFDKDTYKEELGPEVFLVTGGPRLRVFGASPGTPGPQLTKYPLFRINQNEAMINPHHFWPYMDNFSSQRVLGILHYKFLPDAVDRIRKSVQEKNYWKDSVECKSYLTALDNDPDISLFSDCSIRYESPDDLVRAGVIQPIGWPDGARPAVLSARVAYRRRLAELREAQAMTQFLVN